MFGAPFDCAAGGLRTAIPTPGPCCTTYGERRLPASQWPPTRQPGGRQECLIYTPMDMLPVKPNLDPIPC